MQASICGSHLQLQETAFPKSWFILLSRFIVITLKIHCEAKHSSFEVIRIGMKKIVEGDKHLDFSDEGLEQR